MGVKGWLCVWMLIPFFAFGQGGSSLLVADVFATEGSAPAVSVFPSAAAWLKGMSVSVTGENLYGTGIMHYDAAIALPGKNNGWVFRASRAGTSMLYRSAADLSWCKVLTPDLNLTIRAGYGAVVARGYEQTGGPSTGLGLGWRVTDRFTWLFQVDDLHSVFNGQGSIGFELRSGLGYRFSEHCTGYCAVNTRKGSATTVLLGLAYHPVQGVDLKAGFCEDLFMASAGYSKGALALHFYGSWHMALGLSQGLALVFKGRTKE